MTPLKMRRLVELETALRAAGLWGDDSFGPDGKTPAVPPDQRRGVSLSMVNGVPTIRRYPLTTDAEYADAVVLLAAHDWTGATDAAEQLRGQATAAVADLHRPGEPDERAERRPGEAAGPDTQGRHPPAPADHEGVTSERHHPKLNGEGFT